MGIFIFGNIGLIYSNKYVYVGYVEIVYGVLIMFNLYYKKDNLDICIWLKKLLIE